VVFRAVVFKLLVWCGAESYVSGLQDVALLRQHPADPPDDGHGGAPKHVEQAIRSAIKSSVATSWHFISTY